MVYVLPEIYKIQSFSDEIESNPGKFGYLLQNKGPGWNSSSLFQAIRGSAERHSEFVFQKR